MTAWPCAVSYDLDAVLPKSDVVMMLRVQHERMQGGFFPTTREYSRRYGLDARRMATLPDDAIVMHPGPMNRGVEIAAEVADSVRSTIVEQVANGVSVRMAVLYLLLGGLIDVDLATTVKSQHDEPHTCIDGVRPLGGETGDLYVDGGELVDEAPSEARRSSTPTA